MTHPIQAFYNALQNHLPDPIELLRYLHEGTQMLPHFQERLFSCYAEKTGGGSLAWAKCNLTKNLPKLEEAFRETLEREWTLEEEIFSELDSKIYKIACRNNNNRPIDTGGDHEWGKHNRFRDVDGFFEAIGDIIDDEMDSIQDIRSLRPILCYLSKAQYEEFQRRHQKQIEDKVEDVYARLDEVGLLKTLQLLEECLNEYRTYYGESFMSALVGYQENFLDRYKELYTQASWPADAIHALQEARKACFGRVLEQCDFALFYLISRGLKHFVDEKNWDPQKIEILLSWPMRGIHYQLLFYSFHEENLDFEALSKIGPDLFKEYMQALHEKEDLNIRIKRGRIQDFINRKLEEDKLLELLRKLGIEGPFFSKYRGDFTQVGNCTKEQLLNCIQSLSQEDQNLLRSLYAYDNEDFKDFINLAKTLIVFDEKNR